jgi:asparagine synthase (glutamine-hydrolysing)
MFRYLAFVWDPQDSDASQTARAFAQRCGQAHSDWSEHFTHSGLRVFCSGSANDVARGVPLAGDAGIIVGTLFASRTAGHATTPQVESLNESASAAVIASGGRHLLASYWGSYIAFLRDPAGKRKWILKAPMGSLACFRMRYRGVDLFFSRTEDCLALGVSCSFNWSYITAHVVLNSLSTRATALNEIFELKGGECCSIRADQLTTELCWNPGQIAGSNAIDDLRTAARLVHDAVRSCTQTLAAAHRTVLHQLSGGLDSSIVAGCLQGTSATVTCANYYAEGSNSDERYFARLSAAQGGLPLIEVQRPWEIPLQQALSANRTAIIYELPLRLEHAQMVESLRRERKVAAIFTGNGGDEIFHRVPPSPTALDFLRQRGLRPQVARIILNDAILQRVSIWRVMRQIMTLRSANAVDAPQRQLARWLPAICARGLIDRDVAMSLDENPNVRHPWLPALGAAAPGKLGQILALAGRGYDNPFARIDGPELVDPLLSQPVVELCLRIPTYVHTSGGVSRAVARLAFAHLIPQEITERTAKGGVATHFKRLMTHNVAFVRDVLLNGVLVRERLVNRAGLEDALASRPTRSSAYLADVAALFSVELWLQLWPRTERRAVA